MQPAEKCAHLTGDAHFPGFISATRLKTNPLNHPVYGNAERRGVIRLADARDSRHHRRIQFANRLGLKQQRIMTELPTRHAHYPVTVQTVGRVVEALADALQRLSLPIKASLQQSPREIFITLKVWRSVRHDSG